MRHFISLAAVLVPFALSACGTRGGLTLPPGPPPAPIFGNPAPAKPVPKTDAQGAATTGTTSAADLNTATEAAK